MSKYVISNNLAINLACVHAEIWVGNGDVSVKTESYDHWISVTRKGDRIVITPVSSNYPMREPCDATWWELPAQVKAHFQNMFFDCLVEE